MTTAVIGLGNIGKVVARELVDGRERVVLASRKEADAQALAEELGEWAVAATVEDALAQADVVVLAIPFEARGSARREGRGRPFQSHERR